MTLDFFSSSIGEHIAFINPQNRRNEILVTPNNFRKLYELQEDGYTFPPRVTVSDSVCVACEA